MRRGKGIRISPSHCGSCAAIGRIQLVQGTEVYDLRLILSFVLEAANTSQVHPLTPMPLMLCAEFVCERMNADFSFQPVFQAMCNVLQELSPINHLARVYLRRLGQPFQEKDAPCTVQIMPVQA